MDKSSALARAARTFAFGLAGVAGGVATVDWVTDWKAGAVIVALGTISAVLATGVSFFGAVAGWTVESALARAAVTFAQVFGAGLATLAVTELTEAALLQTGQAIMRFAISGAFAALTSYLTNAAEDKAPAV